MGREKRACSYKAHQEDGDGDELERRGGFALSEGCLAGGWQLPRLGIIEGASMV
jgi:hypothetical protein